MYHNLIIHGAILNHLNLLNRIIETNITKEIFILEMEVVALAVAMLVEAAVMIIDITITARQLIGPYHYQEMKSTNNICFLVFTPELILKNMKIFLLK